jgi:hypothetical protein
VAAGDGVTPYSGRGRPSESPSGAGAEDVGLRDPPDGHRPFRARRAGRCPELSAAVRRVIGAVVVSARPHRRALRELAGAELLGQSFAWDSVLTRARERNMKKVARE